MKKHLILLLFSIFSLFACHKPEPNPELRDPIYQDYLSELDLAKKSLEAEEKTLKEHEATYAAVVPQTGQIKYARKRIEESKEKINRFQQQIQYFELKIANRLADTRKKYLEAFRAGKDWPDPKEIEEYHGIQKLRRDKIAADKGERMKPKEPPAKASGASGGGGH